MNYKDELKKIEYYKTLIAKAIASRGDYPASSLIQTKLADINASLSIYRFNTINKGEKFNPKQYNKDLQDIYQDLLILYDCIYKEAQQDFLSLQSLAQRELLELETVAKKCREKTYMENNSIFGKTIFYIANGYEQKLINGDIHISLGNIEAHEQSKLAFILSVGERSFLSSYFKINETHILPYNINQDVYLVPGKTNIKNFKYKLNSGAKNNFFFSFPNWVPKKTNKYISLCGYSQIKAVDNGDYSVTYLQKEQDSAISVEMNTFISFYVYNASYINLEFTAMPKTKNFKNTEIKTPSRIQKIEMFFTENSVFNIYTDGELYMDKTDTYFFNSKLYCNIVPDINDYFLEEYSEPDKVTFPVELIVPNADKPYYDIRSIAVKERMKQFI